MKRKAICALSTVLFLISLFSVAVPEGLALENASDYFSVTDVWATAQSGGKVRIDFDINATHQMLEVGAKAIYICEQQSNGKYTIVETYTSDDRPDFINTKSAFGDGYVVYPGTPGVNYYGLLELYARDSEGSETLVFSTKVVTARP